VQRPQAGAWIKSAAEILETLAAYCQHSRLRTLEQDPGVVPVLRRDFAHTGSTGHERRPWVMAGRANLKSPASRIDAESDRGTGCYAVNMSTPEITQRDLRSKSREIMDAVEHGQSFTVTRDGHRIGELIPIRQRRRFVSRQEFAAMSRNAPETDLEGFRADQDAAADHEAGSAYER
jgi:prevent-host-death family protein